MASTLAIPRAVSISTWLSPRALYDAFPKDLNTWLALLKSNGREFNTGAAAGSIRLVYGAIASTAKAGLGLARSPGTTIDWGMDVVTKTIRLADRQIATPTSAEAFLPTGNGA